MTLVALRAQIEELTTSDKVKIGHYRFANRLKWLLPHLESAAMAMKESEGNEKTSNEAPANAFFHSRHDTGNARNALFHLEALTRIYETTHANDADSFESLNNDFKELEDGLGRIDYYEAFLEEAKESTSAAGNKITDGPAVCGYFAGGYHAELQNLTKRLKDSEWLVLEEGVVSSPRLESILETLADIKWKKAKKDRKGILSFLVETLDKVIDKGGHGDPAKALNFSQLEDGVHEFRRTVRWMSIYPQALGGLCELTNNGPDALDTSLSAYYTDEIVSGKFNKYDPDPREAKRIGIDASLIFAFSFVIGEIGDVKDGGQSAEALELALERTTGASGAEVHKALHQWVDDPPTSDSICKTVSGIVERFLGTNQIPQRLKACFEDQL